MPQKVIKFKGINRKINEFQTYGECEELINLRPDANGGQSVVKPKHVSIPDVQYDAFYEHVFGDVNNQIAVEDGYVYMLPNIFISDDFTGKKVKISSAGNVLVIYCEEEKRQLIFKFEDDEYKPYDVIVPQIKDVEITYRLSDPIPEYSVVADIDSGEAFSSALQKAASAFAAEHNGGLCGAAVVGCTYELDDGSEIWSTSFIVANVATINGYVEPTLDISNLKVTVTGSLQVNYKLTLSNTDIKGVRKINVYASRPVFPYDVVSTESDDPDNRYRIKKLSLDEENLCGQLMYYQGSLTPDSESLSLTLDFSMEQAGERIMDVTSGCIERVGPSISYNNRFHYYKSDVMHVIQAPTISNIAPARVTARWWSAYVQFDGKWIRTGNKYKIEDGSLIDIIYQMSGVKKMAFVECDGTSGAIASDNDMFYVDLKDSSAYNYSYALELTPTIVSAADFYAIVESEGQLWTDELTTKVLWKKETNAINVSAQFNPYVFPVEYSYSFGGEILDIATSYLPISSTQVGQYPLTVFTTSGIFALEQGGGDVLYSNIVPLQPLVIGGESTPTPYGTFFVSSKNLFLLSGREIVDVSYTLGGGIDLSIRKSDSYKKLCCNTSGGFFDFSHLLSQIDFEDYIKDVALTYDQLHNELYISSNDEDIQYSYVFNLDTKSYHKVSKRYLQGTTGGRYAIEVMRGSRNLVDLHSEMKSPYVPILLQSRPMSLNVMYSHIHRLIMLVDTKLDTFQENADSTNLLMQNLSLSVFASDNLHDWKCIISSQKHDTVLRQIRTNRAAKSYKDYVVLISGVVGTDTDISDLIADYTVVNRRLG